MRACGVCVCVRVVCAHRTHRCRTTRTHARAQQVLYLSTRVVLPSKALTTGGEVVLVELTLAGEVAKCCIRTTALELVPLFQSSLSSLIVRSTPALF